MEQFGKVIKVVCLTISVIFLFRCAEHRNPFDPKNKKTGGEPFNLSATSGFGEIRLTWNPLLLDDKPMEIDFYRIYRKKSASEWALLAKMSKDSTQYVDSEVVSRDEYQYKIIAVKENQESDPSLILSSSAYWFPRELGKIEIPPLKDPKSIAFSSSEQKHRYIVDYLPDWPNYYLYVLDHDDNYVSEWRIQVGKGPVDLDVWHQNGEDHIVVCNWGEKVLIFCRRNPVFPNTIISKDTININSRPISATFISKDKVCVATDSDSLFLYNVVDSTLIKVDSIPIPPDPKELCYLPDSQTIVVVSAGGNCISFINGESFNVESQIMVGLKPQDCAISNDSKWAYVANKEGQESVSIIDIDERRRSSGFVLGGDSGQCRPVSLAFVPVKGRQFGDLLFILCQSDIEGIEASIFTYIIRFKDGIPKAEFRDRIDIESEAGHFHDVNKIRFDIINGERRLYILLGLGVFKLTEL